MSVTVGHCRVSAGGFLFQRVVDCKHVLDYWYPSSEEMSEC